MPDECIAGSAEIIEQIMTGQKRPRCDDMKPRNVPEGLPDFLQADRTAAVFGGLTLELVGHRASCLVNNNHQADKFWEKYAGVISS